MLTQPGWPLYFILFLIVVMLPVGLVWAFAVWRELQARVVLWSLVLCSCCFLGGIWALQQNQVQWSDQHLVLKAGFYQTELVDLANAGSAIELLSVVDLGEYQPEKAIDGIHLPGYHVGWYLLRNQEKAFVMLIGNSREVSLVRSGGQVALVSGNLLQHSPNIVAAL
jgi:hypothetical protein